MKGENQNRSQVLFGAQFWHALGNIFRLRFPRFTIVVRFTREGLIFVLLSLAIGAAAVNTGNNILYLIVSLMLGFIVLSGMVSRRMLLGLKPEIRLPDAVFAGAPAVCYVAVTNRKRILPSLGIRFSIEQPLFPHAERHFFYIPSRETTPGFASIRFPRRGVFPLNEVELSTRFPFSFFIKIRRFASDQVVKVYPALYRISEEMLTRAAEGVTVDSPYRGESHQLLHLRDYTTLDSSKRIHWKASAKLEKLLVKEYQREQGRNLRIYYDVYPAETGKKQQELFENAISLIASLAFLLSEKSIQGMICFPDREFEINGVTDSLMALLDYLTTLTAGVVPQSWPAPATNGEPLVLQLRSRRIRPAATLSSSADRILFLEDWLPVLRIPVEATEAKLP